LIGHKVWGEQCEGEEWWRERRKQSRKRKENGGLTVMLVAIASTNYEASVLSTVSIKYNRILKNTQIF
jgi:hypothetical protein